MSRAYGLGDRELEKVAAKPMTREEIRAVVLHKLRLDLDSVVADIGAGSGSISFEAALLAREGRVFSVEKDRDAARGIGEQAVRLGLNNIEVRQGKAPEAIEYLPPLDRAVVGGSSGELKAILEELTPKLCPGGRIVVSTITLENLSLGRDFFEENFSYEVVMVNTAKSATLGRYRGLKGGNPVFIITAKT